MAPNLKTVLAGHQDLDTWIAEGRIQQSLATGGNVELLTQWMTDCERLESDQKEGVVSTGPEAKARATIDSDSTVRGSGSTLARLGFISETKEFPADLIPWLAQHPVELIASATVKFPESLAHLSIQRIQSAELAVAGEAYDFQRWTNRRLDVSLLQDAYDEYCDF